MWGNFARLLRMLKLQFWRLIQLSLDELDENKLSELDKL